jgi:membrane peptidoglycan carboxypeptidase
VSAIANGGAYMEPRVVRALYRDNRQRIAVRPSMLRQTITPDTAATLTGIMEDVVKHGTGTTAQIPGFTVAGKTGTAQKVVNGRYSPYYYASFVGFVPSRDPAVAIIVVVDSPKAKGYYGGVVSAPVFQRIAVAALRQLGVAPTVNPAPPVLISRTAELPRLVNGPTRRAPAITFVTNGPDLTVPDLRGMSMRDATSQLARVGLHASVSGDGFVVSQDPLPGAPIETGSVCEIVLTRTPGRLPATGVQP